MSTHQPVNLLAARGDAHLAGHGTSGSTNLETIPAILLETSGGSLLAADMVVRRHDGPCRLSDHDGDDPVLAIGQKDQNVCWPLLH